MPSRGGTDQKSSRAKRPRLLTRPFVLIIVSTLAYFMSVGALLPTLPLYVEGPLRGGSIAVGLIVGFFSLSAVVVRPWAGRIGDERGRKMLVVAGAGIVAISIIGYLAIDTLGPLLALRLLGGLGEAMFYVGAASAVADLAPEERRGEALSYFSLGLYGGLAFGPFVGEWVMAETGFEWVWVVAAGCALVAGIVGMGMHDTRPETRSGERGRLINRAGVLPGTVLAASIWGVAGYTSFVPLYALQLGLEGSRFVFGVYSGIVLLVRSVGARIPDHFGPGRTARAALGTSSAGLAVIWLWPSPEGLIAGTVLFAIGQSLAFPALMTIAIQGVPASARASVVGTFTAFFDLSFGLGAVTLGGVADRLGYRGVFGVASAFALGGLGLLVLYRSRDQAKASADLAQVAPR